MKYNDNIITLTQKEVAEILNADADLSAVGFIIENRFDIETEILTKLKKQGICGIVMTPTLTFLGISDDHKDIVYQCDNLTIQITEYVPINRASNKQSCQTSQDIAIKVADVLGSPSYLNWQNFQVIDIQTGEDNGLLVSKVTIQCLVRGDLSAVPTPYDPSIKIPYALKTQLEELSAHFESEISSIPTDTYTKDEVDEKDEAIKEYVTDTYLPYESPLKSGYVDWFADPTFNGFTVNGKNYEFFGIDVVKGDASFTSLTKHYMFTDRSLLVDYYVKQEPSGTTERTLATTDYVDTKTSIMTGYQDTLLSGVTEDDETVEFYILTKAK